MAKAKVFVNGAAGRIGRAVTYEIFNNNSGLLELAGVNDIVGADGIIESLTARDPVHGIYDWIVSKGEKTIGIDRIGKNASPLAFSERDLSKIPYKDMGVDIVMECSGFYGDPKTSTGKPTRNDNGSMIFLNNGVKRVVQTYPAKTADKMIIMGVNHEQYDPTKHQLVSNASCTTKALALPLQVLIDNGVGIEALLMDTTHAATASQRVLESLGQILTHSTGAAKATGEVIPSLKGKMMGMSYRVPTLDGSFANLYFVATSDKELTADSINKMLREAVYNPKYAQRLGIHEGEDAGTFDIVGRRENAVVIPSKTTVIPLPFEKDGKKASLVTVISGYDNELGSSVDPVLLAEYIAKKEISS